jgi:small subunit ribosomal protein S4
MIKGYKCKICRRIGQKLFLKGEKCFTPKCPLSRKPYPPGIFGAKGGGKAFASEYGKLLQAKQKLKFLYGLEERRLKNYVKEATGKKGVENTLQLVRLLESRLDNAVFRLGFAISRGLARQLVSRGFITVNGRTITIPSFAVRPGDEIQIKPQKAGKGLFQNLDAAIKNYTPPKWINLDKEKKTGKILNLPAQEDANIPINLNNIIELYSR